MQVRAFYCLREKGSDFHKASFKHVSRNNNVPTHLLAKDSLISDMRFMHFIAVVIAYPDYEENLLSSLRQGKKKKGMEKVVLLLFFFFLPFYLTTE